MPKHREGHGRLGPSLHTPHGGAHLSHEHPLPNGGFLATTLAVVGALLLTAGFLGVLRLTRDPETQPRAPAPSSPTSAPTDAGPTPNLRAALDDCRAHWVTDHSVLAAVHPAMDQWELHVEAMNQLVAGEITFEQASAFWDQTQVAARRHLAEFERADRATAPWCATPATVAGSETAALRRCAAAARASSEARSAARTTLQTWRLHVRHMEHLQTGMLSPADASRLWVELWRLGEKELTTYHRAEHRAERRSCIG